MAIAVRIAPENMKREDYERVMSELGGEQDGRLSHAAYGDDEVHMFDVWDSRENFDPYYDSLVSHLQANGFGVGIIEVSPVHSRY
jgi:hypothetical protein